MLVDGQHMSLVWYAQEVMGITAISPGMMQYLDRLEELCKKAGHQIESPEAAAVAVATAEQLTPSSGGR